MREERGASVGRAATTFADPGLQARYSEDGVVSVPLLDPETLGSLRDEVERLVPEARVPFTGNFQGDTPESRRTCMEIVRRHVEPAARALLPTQRFFTTAMFVKQPGSVSEKPLHQHWTMVDEDRFSSGLVWVAVTDTDATNGGLEVVLGSHRLHTSVRGTPDLHVPMGGTEVGERLRREFLTPLALHAGSAAIMDDRLLHGSSHNRSDRPRIAVGLAFCSPGADLLHYYYDHDRDVLLRFRVEPEFFLEHPWPERPSGPYVIDVERVAISPSPPLEVQIDSLRPRHG
jgi:hypothetical protein